MRRSTLRVALPAAAAALLFASSAQASVPTLFHTDSGPPFVDPGSFVPPYPPGGTRTLNLVLNPGGVANTSGTICDTGNGDNVCGVFVEIKVDGDLTVSDTGYTSLVSGQMSKHAPDPKTLRVALVTTSSPLPPGPILLGTLTVTSGPAGGTVRLSTLHTVDASLDLMSGAPRTLAYLPEPGFGLGIGAGAAALGLLGRRRSTRGGVR